jgi:hypothetical protein
MSSKFPAKGWANHVTVDSVHPSTRRDFVMAFFKRELSPVERFESALKIKQAERERLAEQLRLTEAALVEKRTAAEKLAVAGAATARLERAEAKMREVDDRARTLRVALAEADEQTASLERAVNDARTQRDRELLADQIEAMAAAIEKAGPGFGAGALALVNAVTKSAAQVAEATRFATSVDAVRREVLSAVDLVCWELRTIAVRTRAGNANLALPPPQAEQPPQVEIERQMIYTLNPLLWRESGEVKRAPAFAMVGLPKALLPAALRHQHVDYLNARRVQTLMHVHGSGESKTPPAEDDPQLVDLDALSVDTQASAQANVA